MHCRLPHGCFFQGPRPAARRASFRWIDRSVFLPSPLSLGALSMQRRCARGSRLFLAGRIPSLAGILAVAVVMNTAAQAQEPRAEEPPLPLKRVVLFSSSVGFFEHQGEVEGTKQIEFAFKASDINDLLKSLVVQDRDGGLVTAVNYGSPEPI